MATSVLIVDDHARFRATAARMLAREGFDIAGEAPDAATGLRCARELQPDVVLLDVGLPDMDGLTVAGRLRREVPGAAVVLVSTRDAVDYERRAGAVGARGFVPKSELSGDTLRAVLARPPRPPVG